MLRGNDDGAGQAQTNGPTPAQVGPRVLSKVEADLRRGHLTIWVPRHFLLGMPTLPASDRYHDYDWEGLKQEFKADFPNCDLDLREFDLPDFVRVMHSYPEDTRSVDVAFINNYGELRPLLKQNAVVQMWGQSRLQYRGWWAVFRQSQNFAAGESFLLWASQRFPWTPWSVSTKAMDAADITAVQEVAQRAIQSYAKADTQALEPIMDPDAVRFEIPRRNSVQTLLSVEPLLTFGNSRLAFTLLAAVGEGDQTFGMAHFGLILRNNGAGWKVWFIYPDSPLPDLAQVFQSFDRLGLTEAGAQALPKLTLLAPADGAHVSPDPRPQISWSTVDAPLATYVVESQVSNGASGYSGRSSAELVPPASIGPSISMQAPFGGGAQPYRWRVWAIGKNGIVSTSDWRVIDFTSVPMPAQKASAPPAEVSVVTVEPACMEWVEAAERLGPTMPPHLTIHYNPRARGARLASAQALTLVIATQNVAGFDSAKIPMTRKADGFWQAEFTPKPSHSITSYSIFFFEDEKNAIDNHAGQYWDILDCERGEPNPFAVLRQAWTYEGPLVAPGIQRAPDLARALAILKADLEVHPGHYNRDYYEVWNYELKLGSESPSAYELVGRELDAFLAEHSKSFHAMLELASFIGTRQRELPSGLVQHFRQAANALPESEAGQINSEVDYLLLSSEEDEQKQAQGYVALAEKYPQSPHRTSAYERAFNCELELKDVAGAEAVLEKLTALDRESAWPLLSMAQLYIDQKIKLDRAVKLLDAADATLTEYGARYSPGALAMERERTEFLRGQAYLLLGDLPQARAHLETAAQSKPDDPKVLYALGDVCERTGDKAKALEAYFTAACAPYEESSAPREAYERLFVAQKQGTAENAEQKVLERVTQNTRRAAAEYTPIPFNRPAPKFSFTDLHGKPFDNQAAKGKPALLTFWSPG
jgi:Tfp pilus assembly protein PilF